MFNIVFNTFSRQSNLFVARDEETGRERDAGRWKVADAGG